MTAERPPFRFSAWTRVGFDETDAQGVVYYGRYMPYFDRARVEYLRQLDLLHRGEPGREFVMRANHVEYHAPARFDDRLEVFLRVERIGTSSVTFQLAAYREDGLLLVTAEQVLVQIDRETHRPVAIGERFRAAISAFEDEADARTGLVADVERIVDHGEEADEILRAAVALIAKRSDAFCGIRFLEDGSPVDGPSAGAFTAPGTVTSIAYDGSPVAELVLGRALPESDAIAELLAPYCLVGWDTGGETWQA